jgi:hypothetical protein
VSPKLKLGEVTKVDGLHITWVICSKIKKSVFLSKHYFKVAFSDHFTFTFKIERSSAAPERALKELQLGALSFKTC